MNINQPLNQILFGPPGTGKTFNTINKAVSIINPEFDLSQDRRLIKAEYERLEKEGRIAFTTFHQSMSYEDFIEGIKPEIDESDDGKKNVYYEVKGEVVQPTLYALLFPVLIVMLAGLSLGFGVIISSMTTKYRDLTILFTFFVQLWQNLYLHMTAL